MRKLLLAASLALLGGVVHAQQILLDKPMKAGNLIVFQEYGNPKSWYYVPDRVSLARINGAPQFSFLKYVVNQKTNATNTSDTEADGGGILHCLVQLGVDEGSVRAAEAAVKRVDEDAKITGPVIFRSGTFSLITSFRKENGSLATSLVGTGKAPLLEGEKAAVSMLLTKLGAQLLWESFKTKTPDISFSFEMEIDGLRGPYKAKLKANFDQIYSHHQFDLAARAKLGPVMLGADIALAFDELRRSGAISMESAIEDKNVDGMMSAAYTKVIEMMFDKDISIEKEKTREPTTLEQLGKFMKDMGNPPFSLTASYQFKQVKKSGTFEFDFSKATMSKMALRFDENIGDLTRYMGNPEYFREVNVDDPLYKQREIAVYLDGGNLGDFKEYVNFVTVRLRKNHESGEVTNDSVRIDRENFAQSANLFKLLYGYKGDKDRDAWMGYEYNVVWNFFGGREVDMGWKKSTAGAVAVAAPYVRRQIQLEGDGDTLKSKNVRMVTVKLTYLDPGGNSMVKQTSIDVAKGPFSRVLVGVMPVNSLDYSYEITWRKSDGSSVKSGTKKGGDDIVFIDEVPA